MIKQHLKYIKKNIIRIILVIIILKIFFMRFIILKMMNLMNIQIFIDKQKKYCLPQEVEMI